MPLPAEAWPKSRAPMALPPKRHRGSKRLSMQASSTVPPPRILICGSLYLAGRVLAVHASEAMTKVLAPGGADRHMDSGQKAFPALRQMVNTPDAGKVKATIELYDLSGLACTSPFQGGVISPT